MFSQNKSSFNINAKTASDRMYKGISYNSNGEFSNTIQCLGNVYDFYLKNNSQFAYEYALTSFFLGSSFKEIKAPTRAVHFLSEAVRTFQVLYNQQPNDNTVVIYLIASHSDLAKCQLSLNQKNEAVTELLSIEDLLLNLVHSESTPELKKCIDNCLRLLIDHGDISVEKKLAYIEGSITLNPTSSAIIRKSLLLMESKDFLTARNVLKNLLSNTKLDESNSNSYADALYHLATCELHLDNSASAIQLLKEAENLYCEDKHTLIAVRLGLALSYNKIKQYEESENYFKNVIDYIEPRRSNPIKAEIINSIILDWCRAADFPDSLDINKKYVKQFHRTYEQIMNKQFGYSNNATTTKDVYSDSLRYCVG